MAPFWPHSCLLAIAPQAAPLLDSCPHVTTCCRRDKPKACRFAAGLLTTLRLDAPELAGLPDQQRPPREIPDRELVALRRHQHVTADVEAAPRAVKHSTSSQQPHEPVGGVGNPRGAGLPVADGALGDAQQLGAGRDP